MSSAIPVFLFHRVGPLDHCRFTVPLKTFDGYLDVIDEEGYTTINASDLLSLGTAKNQYPDRLCVLTFDDGYADIWVYAFPLLKRHQMRATVFVTSDRIGRSTLPRATLEDVWSGRVELRSLYQLPEFDDINSRSLDQNYHIGADFLNRGEIALLSRSGICSVESHGASHLAQYVSNRLRGFLNVRSHWTAVAATFGDRRLGTPVYEISSVYASPRFLDRRTIRDGLAETVAKGGGISFFERSDWHDVLNCEFGALRSKYGTESYESFAEWENRVLADLEGARTQLSQIVDEKVTSLAWPFGKFSTRSLAIASEAGFEMTFSTKCGGYVPGHPLSIVGRVNFKDNDVTRFRSALLRYSCEDVVLREMATAIYNGPLKYAL